jgi:pSer/pThr/pTyr-binding forkhead associated (FHA) protein
MADPRLNSIHLEPRRREDFRRAREVLLNARGWQTLAAESQPAAENQLPEPRTLIQNSDAEPAATLNFWLQDREFIDPLKVGLNTVGRSQDNDVVIEDSYVSRRHCAILVHASNTCEVHDTASKNGTYLNGQRLSGPTRLNSGDEIRMCDRQLLFLTRAEAPERVDPTMTQSD